MVIVFREMLEMALVVGILMAATRGLPRSRLWIGSGVAAGLAGAIFFGVFMEEMESAFAGDGEFLFNAVILFSASLLIAWTVFWMRSHGAEMSKRMTSVASSVLEGDMPRTALAFVAMSAVMREGSEAVFFLFGASQSIAVEGWSMVTGGISGALLAITIGLIIYFGLVRVPVRQLFTVAGWMLMLIAAGMASQAAANLVMIDMLPPLVEPLWNTSTLLANESAMGELLHVLIGYEQEPSAMQVIVYVLALAIMAATSYRLSHSERHSPANAQPAH